MTFTPRDIKDVSSLVAKKLELYMNQERREERFDTQGHYRVNPKMKTLGLMYQVLDATEVNNKSHHRKKSSSSKKKESKTVKEDGNDHNESDATESSKKQSKERKSKDKKKKISPVVVNNSLRVVPHAEAERLTQIANQVFEEQDFDKLHVIHRYRPNSRDIAPLTENGKVANYTLHVGSALHSKHYVDYYLKEGLHTSKKECAKRLQRLNSKREEENKRAKDVEPTCDGKKGQCRHSDESPQPIYNPLIDESMESLLSASMMSGSLTPIDKEKPVYSTVFNGRTPSSRASSEKHSKASSQLNKARMFANGYGYRIVADSRNGCSVGNTPSRTESRAEIASSEEYCKFLSVRNASLESAREGDGCEEMDKAIAPTNVRDLDYNKFHMTQSSIALSEFGEDDGRAKSHYNIESCPSSQRSARSHRSDSKMSQKSFQSMKSSSIYMEGSMSSCTEEFGLYDTSRSEIGPDSARSTSIPPSAKKRSKKSYNMQPIRTLITTPEVPRLGITSDMNDSNVSWNSCTAEDYITAEEKAQMHTDARALEDKKNVSQERADHGILGNQSDLRADRSLHMTWDDKDNNLNKERTPPNLLSQTDKFKDENTDAELILAILECNKETESNYPPVGSQEVDEGNKFNNHGLQNAKTSQIEDEKVECLTSGRLSGREKKNCFELSMDGGHSARNNNKKVKDRGKEYERGEDKVENMEYHRGQVPETEKRQMLKFVPERGDDTPRTMEAKGRLTKSAKKRGVSNYYTMGNEERGLEKEYFQPIEKDVQEMYVKSEMTDEEEDLEDALSSRPTSGSSSLSGSTNVLDPDILENGLKSGSKPTSLIEKSNDGRGDDSASIKSNSKFSTGSGKLLVHGYDDDIAKPIVGEQTDGAVLPKETTRPSSRTSQKSDIVKPIVGLSQTEQTDGAVLTKETTRPSSRTSQKSDIVKPIVGLSQTEQTDGAVLPKETTRPSSRTSQKSDIVKPIVGLSETEQTDGAVLPKETTRPSSRTSQKSDIVKPIVGLSQTEQTDGAVLPKEATRPSSRTSQKSDIVKPIVGLSETEQTDGADLPKEITRPSSRTSQKSGKNDVKETSVTKSPPVTERDIALSQSRHSYNGDKLSESQTHADVCEKEQVEPNNGVLEINEGAMPLVGDGKPPISQVDNVPADNLSEKVKGHKIDDSHDSHNALVDNEKSSMQNFIEENSQTNCLHKEKSEKTNATDGQHQNEEIDRHLSKTDGVFSDGSKEQGQMISSQEIKSTQEILGEEKAFIECDLSDNDVIKGAVSGSVSLFNDDNDTVIDFRPSSASTAVSVSGELYTDHKRLSLPQNANKIVEVTEIESVAGSARETQQSTSRTVTNTNRDEVVIEHPAAKAKTGRKDQTPTAILNIADVRLEQLIKNREILHPATKRRSLKETTLESNPLKDQPGNMSWPSSSKYNEINGGVCLQDIIIEGEKTAESRDQHDNKEINDIKHVTEKEPQILEHFGEEIVGKEETKEKTREEFKENKHKEENIDESSQVKNKDSEKKEAEIKEKNVEINDHKTDLDKEREENNESKSAGKFKMEKTGCGQKSEDHSKAEITELGQNKAFEKEQVQIKELKLTQQSGQTVSGMFEGKLQTEEQKNVYDNQENGEAARNDTHGGVMKGESLEMENKQNTSIKGSEQNTLDNGLVNNYKEQNIDVCLKPMKVESESQGQYEIKKQITRDETESKEKVETDDDKLSVLESEVKREELHMNKDNSQGVEAAPIAQTTQEEKPSETQLHTREEKVLSSPGSLKAVAVNDTVTDKAETIEVEKRDTPKMNHPIMEVEVEKRDTPKMNQPIMEEEKVSQPERKIENPKSSEENHPNLEEKNLDRKNDTASEERKIASTYEPKLETKQETAQSNEFVGDIENKQMSTTGVTKEISHDKIAEGEKENVHNSVTEEVKEVTQDVVTEEVKEKTHTPVTEEIKEKTPDTVTEEMKEKTHNPVTEEMKEKTHGAVTEGVKEKTHTPVTEEIKEKTHTPVTEDMKEKTHTPVTEEMKEKTHTPVTEEIKEMTHTPVTEEIKEMTHTPVTEEIKEKTHTPVTEEVKEKTNTPVAEEVKEKTHTPVTEEVKEKTNTPVAEEVKEKTHTPVTEEVKEKTNTPVTEEIKEKTNTPVTEEVKEKTNTPVTEEVKEKTHNPVIEEIKEVTYDTVSLEVKKMTHGEVEAKEIAHDLVIEEAKEKSLNSMTEEIKERIFDEVVEEKKTPDTVEEIDKEQLSETVIGEGKEKTHDAMVEKGGEKTCDQVIMVKIEQSQESIVQVVVGKTQTRENEIKEENTDNDNAGKGDTLESVTGLEKEKSWDSVIGAETGKDHDKLVDTAKEPIHEETENISDPDNEMEIEKAPQLNDQVVKVETEVEKISQINDPAIGLEKV